MNVEYDPRADAIYVHLSDKPYAYGKDLDNERRIDYASDDTPVGIELLGVSKGVNVSGLPHALAISELLEAKDIRSYEFEDRSQISTMSSNTIIIVTGWSKEHITRIRPTFSLKLVAPSRRTPRNKVVLEEQAVTK